MSERNSWRGMIERCENPRHVGFKYYGARGITVCTRWRKSFDAFRQDMGPKPTPRHTIDRINSDGNYTPRNCRWATPAEQRRNQRPQDDSARVRRSWLSGKRSHVSTKRDDLTGQIFGRLRVICYADTQNRRSRWLCVCQCGAQRVVVGKSLKAHTTKSCGCLNREKARARAIARNQQLDNPATKRWGKR